MDRNTLSKDTVAIAFSILAVGLIIAGAILFTAPRKEEIVYLRGELIKSEALIESALKTLHHERLYHHQQQE